MMTDKQKRDRVKATRKWQIKNPDKVKEYKKREYQKNKERYRTAGKEYYIKNKEQIAESGKKYREENKEKLKEKSRVYNQKNRDKYKEYREKHKEKYKLLRKFSYLKNKEKEKENNSRWYFLNKNSVSKRSAKWKKNNKELVTKYNRLYFSKRKQTDVNFLIRVILRSRISTAIKREYKASSAVKDLGCSIEYLKKHLESQFTEGMSWDNYGVKGWHIDHIIPLAYFDLTKEKDFKQACHYTNLQPLWAVDNIRKGAKVMVQ